MELTNEALHIH